MQQDPTGSTLRCVCVGNTGELDQQAGETMLRERPELVKAAFLHAVSLDQHPDGFNEKDIPPPRFINGRPIIFFRTCVGAAVEAVQLGFRRLHLMTVPCFPHPVSSHAAVASATVLRHGVAGVAADMTHSDHLACSLPLRQSTSLSVQLLKLSN